jgi:hypothetical protein
MELHRPGKSLREIAEELDRLRIAPPRGEGNWKPEQVKRVLVYAAKVDGQTNTASTASPPPAVVTPAGADISLLVSCKVVGPYTTREVVEMLRSGAISPTTMHKRPNMKAWRSLERLAQTFVRGQPTTGPSPAPSGISALQPDSHQIAGTPGADSVAT